MNTCICTTRKQWGTRARHRTCAGLLAALAAVFTANLAQAQQPGEPAPQQYNINADTLGEALNELATQSKLQITYPPELVYAKTAPAINGEFTWRAALNEILADSGLEWGLVNGTTVVIKKATAPATTPSEDEKEIDEARAKDEPLELEEMIVVGSRLGVVSPGQSALPIRVISRDDIDRSGAGNIAQVLSQLPEVSLNNVGDTNIGSVGGSPGGVNGNAINATSVQLRGLPLGTVLILIDGRRSGESSAFSSSGLFDLSTVPLAMVERIEVLPAGASAVYGGDGLAGVINIVLRRDFSGFELRGRYGAADGYDESQASVMWGKTWSRGQLSANATWRENSALTSAERSLTADRDFSRFGGLNRTSTAAHPATVFSLDGCPPPPAFCAVPLEDRGNLPGLDAPVATVPAGQDGQNLTPDDFADTAGMQNRSSEHFNLFSPEESYSLALNGTFEVTPELELFTEMTYTRRDLPAVELPLFSPSGQFGNIDAVVPASNAFNPFGVDVGVDYRFENTGVFNDFSQTFSRGLIGARGWWGKWEWELAGWWSRDRSDIKGASQFANTFITDPDGNPFDQRVQALASSDPATALNLFVGDDSPPGSLELMNSLAIPHTENSASDLGGADGFIRGPLATLPAGDILGLIGASYQKQSLDSAAANGSTGSDTSHALYGEVRVPIWANQEPERWERLALTGAVRRESTDRFEEDATTETLGLEFRPWRPLLLRATYSTAFKPPLIFNEIQPPLVLPFPVSDPAFDGEIFLVEQITGGGIPLDVKPETSTTTTVGVVYAPTPDYRVSITHFDSRFRNRLASTDAQSVVNNEANLPDRVIRDPETGVIVQVDTRLLNITKNDVAGVDLTVDGRWYTRYGDFLPSLALTYTYNHDQQFTPTSPVTDNVAVNLGGSWSPRWKVVPQLGWGYQDRLYVTVTGRYVSEYEDWIPLFSGPDAGTNQMLGDFWMADLNVDWNLGRWFAPDSDYFSGTTLNVGATNLFDRLPDFCNSCLSTGYDASQYDIRGRAIYAELRLSL